MIDLKFNSSNFDEYKHGRSYRARSSSHSSHSSGVSTLFEPFSEKEGDEPKEESWSLFNNGNIFKQSNSKSMEQGTQDTSSVIDSPLPLDENTNPDLVDILFTELGFDFKEDRDFSKKMASYFISKEYQDNFPYKISTFYQLFPSLNDNFLSPEDQAISFKMDGHFKADRFFLIVRYYTTMLIEKDNGQLIFYSNKAIWTSRAFEDMPLEVLYYIIKMLSRGAILNPIIIAGFINTAKEIFGQEPRLLELNLKNVNKSVTVAKESEPENLDLGCSSQSGKVCLNNFYYRNTRHQNLEDRCGNIDKDSNSTIDKLTVVGDLHGKYQDIVQVFIKNGPVSATHAYLFNGDLVDRYPQSLELLMLLMGLKIIYPNRLFINRGNHECATTSARYGFRGELILKYCLFGLYVAKPLHYQFCEMFASMPVAALVDDEVFIAHGGIPVKQKANLDDIRRLDTEGSRIVTGHLRTRDLQLMSEILWNDPYEASKKYCHSTSHARELLAIGNGAKVSRRYSIGKLGMRVDGRSQNCLFRKGCLGVYKGADLWENADSGNNEENGKGDENAEEELSVDEKDYEEEIYSIHGVYEGLVENGKQDNHYCRPSARGKGVYSFTKLATEKFCEKNKLDLIIRSHEHVSGGLSIHHGGKIITVFSSCNYQKSGSEAAVINYSRYVPQAVDIGEQVCEKEVDDELRLALNEGVRAGVDIEVVHYTADYVFERVGLCHKVNFRDAINTP